MNPDRLYPGVERAALLGQSRKSVYEMLAVNSITGEEADALVNRAFRERTSVIRSHFLPRIIKGLLLVFAGAMLFSIFWFYLGGITRLLFVLSASSASWGIWWVIDGGINWLILTLPLFNPVGGPVERILPSAKSVVLISPDNPPDISVHP